MTHEFSDDNIIFRYLMDDLSTEERLSIESELSGMPSEMKFVKDFREAKRNANLQGKEEFAADMAEIRQNITDRIVTREGADEHLSRVRQASITSVPVRHSYSSNAMSKFAPLAVVASLLSLVLIFGLQSFGSRKQTGEPLGLASVYSTPNGQRATLSLPDGSFAVLNVGSRLEIPANYGAGNRQVRLTGAAVFTVNHQDKQPFSVVTGSTVTRVLGTVFSVRSYESDTAVIVAVKEGRVSVQSKVVSASQSIVVSRQGTISVTEMAEGDSRPFDFIDGRLNIVNTPLSDAIVELNRWYDADVRIGSASLENQRIGGMFTSGSKESLVSILENALGFRVVQRGRVITIYE